MREGLLGSPRLKLELRTEQSRFAIIGVSLMAIAATFAVGMILLAVLGRSPIRVADAFFVQPFTSLNGIGEILLKTGPLLLIAQGLAVGYRANVWNIGAEGQLIVGAIAAGVVALTFDSSNSVFKPLLWIMQILLYMTRIVLSRPPLAPSARCRGWQRRLRSRNIR